MKFALLTISDSCSSNPELDKSGPAIKECLSEYKQFENATYTTGIVPDDFEAIKAWLLQQIPDVQVILTTGGTGFSARDVTPEATRSVVERPCPGIVVALFQTGLQKTPLAALSRLEAGIAKNCLIVNLPGSPKAVRESIPVLAPIIPHAVSLLQEDKNRVQQTHEAMQK